MIFPIPKYSSNLNYPTNIRPSNCLSIRIQRQEPQQNTSVRVLRDASAKTPMRKMITAAIYLDIAIAFDKDWKEGFNYKLILQNITSSVQHFIHS